MKKSDLKRINYLNKEICKLEAKKHEIDSELTSIKSTSDFKMLVQESIKKSDYKEMLISEKIGIEKEILEKKNELDEKIRILMICVSNLNNESKKLIKYRYVFGLSFQKVAKLMNYSESYIFSLHNKIVKRLD
ncbi:MULTISPECIES: hypothetical protein [Helcococcus]|uniref:Sigma-70 family RNA polymerase sigma factor n=1 Tax=Helcococcus bovis TaxID=3153252 RepID=A0ABW9F7K6_9FIRM